jgi:hypothetical protein
VEGGGVEGWRGVAGGVEGWRGGGPCVTRLLSTHPRREIVLAHSGPPRMHPRPATPGLILVERCAALRCLDLKEALLSKALSQGCPRALLRAGDVVRERRRTEVETEVHLSRHAHRRRPRHMHGRWAGALPFACQVELVWQQGAVPREEERAVDIINPAAERVVSHRSHRYACHGIVAMLVAMAQLTHGRFSGMRPRSDARCLIGRTTCTTSRWQHRARCVRCSARESPDKRLAVTAEVRVAAT